MRTPPPRFFPDVVVIHAPASGTDPDAVPSPVPGPPAAPRSCSVQELRETNTDPGVFRFGVQRYEVLFPTDPGVLVAGQQLDWTMMQGVTLAPAVVLIAEGVARPLQANDIRWTVSASRRA